MLALPTLSLRPHTVTRLAFDKSAAMMLSYVYACRVAHSKLHSRYRPADRQRMEAAIIATRPQSNCNNTLIEIDFA